MSREVPVLQRQEYALSKYATVGRPGGTALRRRGNTSRSELVACLPTSPNTTPIERPAQLGSAFTPYGHASFLVTHALSVYMSRTD